MNPGCGNEGVAMFTGNETKGVASVPDLEAKNLDPGCGNEEMGVALPAQALGVATEDQGVAPLAQKVNNGVATDLRHKSDEGVAIVSETWDVATDLGYGKVGVALLAQNKTNCVARDCELGVALLAQSETSGVATSACAFTFFLDQTFSPCRNLNQQTNF